MSEFPPLPPGFELAPQGGAVPPLPPGFEMAQPSQRIGLSDIASSAWRDIKKAAGNVASSVYSGVTLPRDVITGNAQLPSSGAVPGSVEFGDPRSAGGRVADMAMLATPLSPAARAGETAIPGVAKAAVTEKAAVPTAEAIKDASKAGFETAKNAGVEIAAPAVRDMAAGVQQALEQKGIIRELAPNTHAVLERLANPPEGATATISGLHAARQALGHAGKSITSGAEKPASSIAIDALDQFLQAVPPKAVLAGDAPAAGAALKEAIGNYASAARAGDVDARLTRAERQAARSGSGSNIDNSIRQKISAILDVPSRTRGFSADELAQMEKVVRGTGPANVARKIGKLGVNDGLSLMLHAGAAAGTGGASIPVAVVGTVARKIAERLTQRQADKLDAMIRARSPLARSQQPTTRELTGGEQGTRGARVRAIAEMLNAQGQR